MGERSDTGAPEGLLARGGGLKGRRGDRAEEGQEPHILRPGNKVQLSGVTEACSLEGRWKGCGFQALGGTKKAQWQNGCQVAREITTGTTCPSALPWLPVWKEPCDGSGLLARWVGQCE